MEVGEMKEEFRHYEVPDQLLGVGLLLTCVFYDG